MNNNAAALPIALLSQSSTGREQSHYVLLLGDNTINQYLCGANGDIFQNTRNTSWFSWRYRKKRENHFDFMILPQPLYFSYSLYNIHTWKIGL